MTAATANLPEDADGRRIESALLDWMQSAPAGFVGSGAGRAEQYGLAAAAAAQLEARFEALALEIFAYQCERVPAYRAFAARCGRTPEDVRSARDVPALPVEAFREVRLATFPPERERAVFHTSGTTGDRPGVLRHDSLALYDLALARGFRHHVLPDVDRMRMFLLVPDVSEAPHSSLAYMLQRVRATWGTPQSRTYVRGGDVQWRELKRDLQEAHAAREPVCLLGTAFLWVHVLDACLAERFRVDLAPGSRVFETGGFKGRSRTIARARLVAGLERCLGVPATHVVGEYGMTEMGSQLYTTSLRRALDGLPPADTGWSYPAWLRPRILDSETGAAVDVDEARETGLLAHHDLANRGSVAHLLTSDLGRPRAGSFDLCGRAPRADARGCGLVDEGRSVTRT